MQTAVPIWALIAIALISALAGIGGAVAGPLIQRRTTSDEATRQRAKLRLKKAEDIYVELDRISSSLSQFSILAASLLKSINAEKSQVDEPASNQPPSSLGRVRGLIAIYFPEGNAFFAEYDAKEIAGQQEFRALAQEATSKGSPNAVTGAVVVRLMSSQTNTSDLVKRLREFMDALAADLPGQLSPSPAK